MNFKQMIGGLLAAAAVGATGAASAATPVQWATNGHYYQFVSGSFTWEQANAAAEASSYLGLNGYLATITSSAEQQFVLGLPDDPNDGWLGGSDQALEGAWKWVGGPEAGQTFWNGGSGGSAPGGAFASWNSGEPNDANGEDYLQLQNGAWNDLPNGSNRGYYVEFSGAAVPEPASWALMILGFGATGALVRRRRTALA